MVRLTRTTLVLSAIVSITIVAAVVAHTRLDRLKFKQSIDDRPLPVQTSNTGTENWDNRPITALDSNGKPATRKSISSVSAEGETAPKLSPLEIAELERLRVHIDEVVLPEIDRTLEYINSVLAESDELPPPPGPSPFYDYVQSRIKAGATEEEIVADPELQRLLNEEYGIIPPWEDENQLSDAELQQKLDYVDAIIIKYGGDPSR